MSKAKDKIAEDEMFEKARIKIDEIRVRLKEYVATCTGEDRDFLVYRLPGEFDPHDEEAIAYVAERVMGWNVSWRTRAHLVGVGISQQSHGKRLLPVITPDEYNSYLEEAGVAVNETILESVISRKKRVQHVRNTRRMVYVPFSPPYGAFAKEIREVSDEVDSWYYDRAEDKRKFRLMIVAVILAYILFFWLSSQ